MIVLVAKQSLKRMIAISILFETTKDDTEA